MLQLVIQWDKPALLRRAMVISAAPVHEFQMDEKDYLPMQNYSTQDDGPFTNELARGTHQMGPVYFRLEVLERYLNDPRCQVRFFDFGGSIHVLDQSRGSGTLTESDRIRVQRFGLAYQADGTRVIIVFLRRLAELSLEHQLYWLSYRLHEQCTISSDYLRTSIDALPAENVSAYEAFLQEQVVINNIAVEIGRLPLFRVTYDQQSNMGRPREFSAFIRPTLKNYSEFVHLLDKLLSDNINRKFFRGEISSRTDDNRKGTITMLEEWLRKEFPES